jgi:hypothetical protein
MFNNRLGIALPEECYKLVLRIVSLLKNSCARDLKQPVNGVLAKSVMDDSE